jgi:hypothetical protein
LADEVGALAAPPIPKPELPKEEEDMPIDNSGYDQAHAAQTQLKAGGIINKDHPLGYAPSVGLMFVLLSREMTARRQLEERIKVLETK